MRLGYVDGPALDATLAGIARDLAGRGLRLAGAVQETEGAAMRLRLLPGGGTVRISQDLGPGASGCRLDPAGLEAAVGAVAAALPGAGLLIVNRFGRQEAEGRGFRPVIAEALMAGVPVLTGVSAGHRAAFLGFADGLAEPVDPAGVADWLARAG